jgi:hypothetical protein
MRTYAPFSDWLHAGYCFHVRVGAFDVYRRKTDDAACPIPWFPQPAPAVDWRGKPLDVLLPLLADEALTKPLPRADRGEPVWFKGAPVPAGVDALRDRRDARALHDGLRAPQVDWENAVW